MTQRLIENAICPFCGCLCDDLRLAVESDHIREAGNACALGVAGYAAASAPSGVAALVAGQAAALESAIEAAAQLLVQARFPLIFGLLDTTCEAQRQAVALADLLGANLDIAASPLQRASAQAMQQHGAHGATLGEIKNRADLVLFWGGDPAATHPRHMERYSVRPVGSELPNGRHDRTVIVLDHGPTASAEAADHFIQITPGRDFEVISGLRALLRDRPGTDRARLAEAAGLPLETLQSLAARLRGCAYGVMFFGPRLAEGPGGAQTISALLALVRELNAHTPFAAQALGGHGNALGAENVLTWQTGYAGPVNFSRGYPRSIPGEFSAAELLARGEADAVLLIGSDPTGALSGAAVEALRRLPCAAVGPQAGRWARWARVVVNTAWAGVETGGTFYRMDEVPLTLRPARKAANPTTESVLGLLIEQLGELSAARLAAGGHAG